MSRSFPQRKPSFLHSAQSSVLFIAVFLFVLSAAHAANFYVRAGATGSRSGSDWTNAWSDFSQLNWSSIDPGDTIYIAGGNYGPLSINKSGTSGNPITFKRAAASAHGTDSGWSASYDNRVVIDGNGGLYAIGIGEGGSFAGQSYITVDGVTRYGIWLRHASYGVRADRDPKNNNLTFRFIEMGDAGANKMGEDGIQGKGDNLLVENCYIHDNDNVSTHGDGIQWFEGNNVTIRYSVFKNNGQQMMLTETAWGNDYVNDLNVYYNVFYNRGGSHYNGISKKLCPEAGHYWRFYNNTFDLEAKDNSGYNNIFSGTGSCAQMDFKNNAVVYSNAGSVGGVSHSYNGYDNASPYLVYNIPSETGRVTAADLGFVNIEGANYHLLASSPLIGKGVNVGLTRDFDGNPLPATPSIGAFEFGAAGVTPTPAPIATATPRPTTTPSPTGTPARSQSLFTTQTPDLLSNNDGKNYELGLRFTATVAGQITGVRFYKSPSETETHTGKVYSAAGALLGSVPFTKESRSGWQTANFARPISINANMEYVVTVNTGNKYYAATVNGLSAQISNGNLRSVVGSNGVFGPVGSKPNQTYKNTNYFRDVIFEPR